MAKFDPTQVDCSDSANLSRWEAVKTLIASVEADVAKTASNNSAVSRARKSIKEIGTLLRLLGRTLQVRKIERSKERKIARATKKAAVITPDSE